jgi:RNA polymerase sigma-70 factor (ECF subfamily)
MPIDPNTSDCDLIRFFKEGSTLAADEIARRHYPGVLRVCCRYMGSVCWGQDAAQIVFLKVLGEKKIFRFRQESSLRTWLFRVAVNTCNTELRRKWTISEVSLGDEHIWAEVETRSAGQASPEEILAGQENQARLDRILSQLPAKYQAALQAAFGKESSYREAAQELGLGISALGVQIFRGKRMLEKAFVADWKQGRFRHFKG